MALSKDWFPAGRDKQLAMARNWTGILPAKGTAWRIPPAEIQDLANLTAAAESALGLATNDATRTPVATARCRDAFKQLGGKMRDIKRRYFYEPPLTGADMVSLGLKPRDTIHTPISAPTAQVTGETYLIGAPRTGDQDRLRYRRPERPGK
jgi:hypothetical protein